MSEPTTGQAGQPKLYIHICDQRTTDSSTQFPRPLTVTWVAARQSAWRSASTPPQTMANHESA